AQGVPRRRSDERPRRPLQRGSAARLGGRVMSPVGLNEERIDTAVGKVQVWRGGAGTPVVYLHSAMGEGPGLAFLEELADTNDVVAPVFPGFGESEGSGETDDMEDAVFHVLDVLDQLGLAALPFVVLSLGWRTAAEVAPRST